MHLPPSSLISHLTNKRPLLLKHLLPLNIIQLHDLPMILQTLLRRLINRIGVDEQKLCVHAGEFGDTAF